MNAAVPVEEIRLGVVMLCHNELAIAARTRDYAAVIKPAGLHSAAICGVAAAPASVSTWVRLIPGMLGP